MRAMPFGAPLMFVERLGPKRTFYRAAGKFVKTLPEELWTESTHVDLAGLTGLDTDRRNAHLCLHL